MRKKYNNNNNNKHRGGGGGRRYQGGGNRGGQGGDHQNLSRQKHHATQMREKFNNMARDAQNNGDRVDVEYFLQHVDHYNRVLADIAVIEAERFAHQREQHAQLQASEGGEQPTEGGDNNGSGGNTADDTPITPQHQPRMTRGRHYHQNRHEAPAPQPSAPESGGEEASEIPLPGLPSV